MDLNVEFHLDAVEIEDKSNVALVKEIATEGTQVGVFAGELQLATILEDGHPEGIYVREHGRVQCLELVHISCGTHLPRRNFFADLIACIGISLF
uniref:Uncharacterized protein n=1 Tax=Cannabis sativa TaxID=3483 RepID=A0A803QBN1_CANSA